MWWRWFLVLPGFLVGAVVVPALYFLGYMVVHLITGDLNLNENPPFWAKLSQSIISGYAAIYVGAIAVPSGRRIIAIGLTLLMSGVLFYLSIWGRNDLEAMIHYVATLGASVFAVYVVWGRQSSPP